MKTIYVYLKDYKKESVLAPLFKMLEAIFELLVPLVMKHVIDIGIAGRDIPYIVKMCLIMVLLGAVGLLASVTAQYYAAKAATGFGTQMRKELFAHIQHLSFTRQDEVGTSTLITRMTSDINIVQNGVNMVLRLFLRSPFIVFGAMIMAFTIDVKGALVFAVTIPVLAVIVFGIICFTIPLYRKVQEKLDKVTLSTRENLTGVRVIRAFHMEEKEQKTFYQRVEKLTESQLQVGNFSALMNPVTYVVINVGLAVLIYQGAIEVSAGVITQGAVVALVNYMSQILVELIKLANLIVSTTKALACAKRVESIFQIPTAQEDERQARKNTEKSTNPADEEGATSHEILVEFKHAGLTYQGAKEEALTDITFQAKKGETIGVIGGTGSGKSSLVNLIPGFYRNTAGIVKVAGQDVKNYEKDKLRNKIGVVMQKSVLFKGTIAENIRWGKADATEGEIREALETAQALDFVEQKEHGINAEVAQGGKNFSGGQKQRLTIARALVKKPEILILDDSASALDFATDAALRSAIRRQTADLTVFIVSQRASSVMSADQIIVLEDGKMAGIGTHDALLKDCEVYQEIYYSQYPDKREGA